MNDAIKAIIFDFDNTLYDWVDQWHAAFSAMLSKLEEVTQLPVEVLKKDIRSVYRAHKTSEYAFVIGEMESIQKLGLVPADYLAAVEAYRLARKQHLRLFPEVMDTLLQLRRLGIKIGVFTESMSFYSIMRFKKLGLDGVVDYLYTSKDHVTPDAEQLDLVRSHEPSYYQLSTTKQRAIGAGRLKPDAKILDEILVEMGCHKSEAVYVGDSLLKDILMANSCGVCAVWAKFGESRSSAGYDLLREVSHWSDEDIVRDRLLKESDVKPDIVLDKGIKQLLPALELACDSDARR